MKIDATIGIGLEIYKHKLYLSYNTTNHWLEGILELDTQNDKGDDELWNFDVYYSGEYFLFDFIPPSGPVSVSLKEVAEKIFGPDEVADFPEIKLSCARIFFLHAKKNESAGIKENVTMGGIELAMEGIELDSISVGIVELKNSNLKLDELLLLYSSKVLKIKDKSKKVSTRKLEPSLNDDDPNQEDIKKLLGKINIAGAEKGFSLGALIKEGESSYRAVAPMKVPTDTSKKSLSTVAADKPKAKNIEKWINLEKNIGPVDLQRIGVRFAPSTGKVSLLLDAYIHGAGLEMSLMGFGLSFDIRHHFDRSVTLSGLGLGYSSDGFSLAGAFMRFGDANYAGMLNLKFGQLDIFGIGAYQKINNLTSVFGYVVLKYPLGGPPPFFVTGLAAGFGFNRDIVLPDIKKVQSFPLVSWATGKQVPIESDATGLKADTKKSKTSILKDFPKLVKQINDVIPFKKDQYWLAFGIKFTSFEFVDCFALFSVSFGNRLEIGVLGTASMQLPKQLAKPYFKVDILLKARYAPDIGLFSLEAALSEDSYILDKNCRLTGGLAFYSWFAGPNKGDFVFSLGGYHPDFKTPKIYPDVDPIGLNWKISDHVQISGKAYFTVTPSLLMAGYSSKAIVTLSKLRIVFGMSVDILLQWAPFYYQLDVKLGLSVRYSKHTFLGTIHIHFSIGATLNIKGPEFSGRATIKFTIVSFSIRFGQHNDKPVLTWDKFHKQFLQDKSSGKDNVLTLHPLNGLVDEIVINYKGKDLSVWFIDPEHLDLNINTKIPIKKASGLKDDSISTSDQMGIRSMDIENDGFSSDFEFNLHKGYDPTPKSSDEIKATNNELKEHFVITRQKTNVPSALWGKPVSGDQEKMNADATVDDIVNGYRLVAINKYSSKPWVTAKGQIAQKDLINLMPTDPKKKFVSTGAQVSKAEFESSIKSNSHRKEILDELTKSKLFSELKLVNSTAKDSESLFELRHGIMPTAIKLTV